MKIGIEAQRIFRKNKHGMDYVVLQEIKELQQMDTDNEYFVFVKPGEDRCIESSKNVHVVELKCPSYPLWEQWALPRAAKKCKVDLLHCTSNTAPIWGNIPLVLTLHDIIFLEKKRKYRQSLYQNFGWYYRRIVVPHILKRCKLIITVSNFEKNNIIKETQLPENKIAMLHNSYNKLYKLSKDHDTIYKKYIEEPEYFFILGNTDQRKNIEGMIIAFSKYLKMSKKKKKLLITSLTKSQLNDILILNNIESIESNIVTTGYVPNEDLPCLYNNAFAFLFVSFREGFGIPVLESMACGTPVITSNTSSIPEVAGPDAILVNPHSSKEIADMMLRLETDDAFYREQIKIGLERSKLFSWEKTVKELLLLYKKIYQETH